MSRLMGLLENENGGENEIKNYQRQTSQYRRVSGHFLYFVALLNHDAHSTFSGGMEMKSGRTEPSFNVPRYVSDREAALMAKKIADIRRRSKIRSISDKFYNAIMYTIFFLLGVTGIYLGFEMASFIWGMM